ncbi:MAG: NAD(P)-binding domain-containing protein [Rhodoferax sp.]
MKRRVMKKEHTCVVHDMRPEAVAALHADGAVVAAPVEEFIVQLERPRGIWLMVPAAIVDTALNTLAPQIQDGGIVIDGGNSFYHDDVRRAKARRESGVHYVDVGEERGYCLMIDGEETIVRDLTPVFSALAPGVDTVARTSRAQRCDRPGQRRLFRCSRLRAGRFVKMVHDGIEEA